MNYDFDLFVIGGGSGGVRAARLAGSLGKRVALAEEYRVGGTCVIRGCVPKKLMVYASTYSEAFRDSAAFGWTHGQAVFDWSKFIMAKDNEISRLEALYRKGLATNNVTIFDSRAKLVDRHTIEIVATGQRVKAETILIATGGHVALPEGLIGQELCITSNEIFDLKEKPKSILIAGGGYIAVEFANIMHGLGVETTLIYRGDLILRKFDLDVRQLISQFMTDKGIKIIYGSTIKKVESIRDGAKLHVTLSNAEELRFDKVLLAVGRAPNTQKLGLEEAGVVMDQKGAICVDNYMRTSVANIYAVGDVTNRIHLTPVAIHEAMCFIETVFRKNPKTPDLEFVPTAVFSQPEIGTVGLTEEEAAQKYPKLDVYRALFRPMRNTISGNSEQTLMKLLVDGETQLIVGVHILGAGASEIIQVLGVAVKGKLSKQIFDETMAVHPTAAEELVTMYQASYRYENGIRVI